jgi:hypothetical protein
MSAHTTAAARARKKFFRLNSLLDWTTLDLSINKNKQTTKDVIERKTCIMGAKRLDRITLACVCSYGDVV